MAVTHNTTVRNSVADVVVDAIDAGGAGTIVFQNGDNLTLTSRLLHSRTPRLALLLLV